jgi:hypothetical protein
MNSCDLVPTLFQPSIIKVHADIVVGDVTNT